MIAQQRIQRVNDLVIVIIEFSFFYVRRGLFESHKLIFSTFLAFKISLRAGKNITLSFFIEGKKR